MSAVYFKLSATLAIPAFAQASSFSLPGTIWQFDETQLHQSSNPATKAGPSSTHAERWRPHL